MAEKELCPLRFAVFELILRTENSDLKTNLGIFFLNIMNRKMSFDCFLRLHA